MAASPEPPGPSGAWRRFCPTYTAGGVTEVTPALLQKLGIRGVILDLDNTLVPWHVSELAEEVAGWVAAVQGAGIRLCIASNTHRPARLKALAERLGVLYATGVAKPRRGGFRRSMKLMGVRPAETLVIGDQVLTDILGGNRCELLTVLVPPLHPHEFIGTRLVSRRIERWLLARFTARGWLRPLSDLSGSATT